MEEKYIADLGSKGLQIHQSSQHVAGAANSAIRWPKHTERLFLISLLSIINRKHTENIKYKLEINTKAYFESERCISRRYIAATGGYLLFLWFAS